MIPSGQNPESDPLTPLIPVTVWAFLALGVAIRAGIALGTAYTADDALITLRYAENLAHGAGFVYNPGERILGTTTPFYAVLLALFSATGLPALAAGKAINIAADTLVGLVLYVWLRYAGHEREGRFAALWTAVNPVQVWWSISGMEAGLVVVATTSIWYMAARARWMAAFAAAGLLLLLRVDGLLLVAVLTVYGVLQTRRVPIRPILMMLAIIAPWLVFAAAYFGSPVPSSAIAKLAVYRWHQSNSLFPELSPLINAYAGSADRIALSLLALLGLFVSFRQKVVGATPAIAWMALYWALFLQSKVPLFGWYQIPPYPICTLLAALGAGEIVRHVPRLERLASWRASAIIAAMAAAAYFTPLSYAAIREEQTGQERLMREVGWWIRARSRPDERIMAEAIGYIGYYGGRPILDSVGIVSPQVIPYWRDDRPVPPLDIALAFQPEWCVLRPLELAYFRDARAGQQAEWARRYLWVKAMTHVRSTGGSPIVFHIYRRRRK